MWAALAEPVGAHGYHLERGQCRGANGYTDPAGRLVRIRADVEEAMAVRVLAHELAHLECGHCEHGGYRYRGRCEVEAESVGWLIARISGWTPATTPCRTSPAGHTPPTAPARCAKCGPRSRPSPPRTAAS